MNRLNRMVILFAVLFFIGLGNLAQAFMINIDPGAYTGTYRIQGQTSTISGILENIELSAGNYVVQVANTQNLFKFNVDAMGDVTSLNTVAAEGVGDTLTFNTTTIIIDPAAYTGTYLFRSIESNSATGLRSFTLLPGLNNYQVLIFSTQNQFTFNVDAVGDVTSLNTVAAEGDGNTLTFNTTTITINPAAYTGTYSLDNKISNTGLQSFTLLPGINNYQVQISSDQNTFRFNIDAAGNVTSQNTAAAVGVGDTLTFNTTTITVDPTASFTGNYRLVSVDNTLHTGEAMFTLLPGMNRYLLVSSFGTKQFSVADPCAVDPEVFVLGGFTFNITCVSPVPVFSCIGFEPPMDGGPVTVKKNRVLPFKAVIQDESGNPIIDLDIVSPPVIQVLFDSGMELAVDVTDDALPAGQGTDGNQFEFGTDKWQFNLKTKNYTAEGTYTVSIVSGDDSEYTINPTCVGTFVIE